MVARLCIKIRERKSTELSQHIEKLTTYGDFKSKCVNIQTNGNSTIGIQERPDKWKEYTLKASMRGSICLMMS